MQKTVLSRLHLCWSKTTW